MGVSLIVVKSPVTLGLDGPGRHHSVRISQQKLSKSRNKEKSLLQEKMPRFLDCLVYLSGLLAALAPVASADETDISSGYRVIRPMLFTAKCIECIPGI
jgi:hypothetical protein